MQDTTFSCYDVSIERHRICNSFGDKNTDDATLEKFLSWAGFIVVAGHCAPYLRQSRNFALKLLDQGISAWMTISNHLDGYRVHQYQYRAKSHKYCLFGRHRDHQQARYQQKVVVERGTNP